MIDSTLVLITIFVASALQGFSGFGYGLALMALLPLFLPITTATVLVSFSSTFIGLYMNWRNWRNTDLQITIYPLIGSLLFIPFGVYLLNYLDEQILKNILGFVLVLVAIFFFLHTERQL